MNLIIGQPRKQKRVGLDRTTHFSAKVDNAGVGIIEGQQDSVTRVHLLNTYRLIHVVLETQKAELAGIIKPVWGSVRLCTAPISPAADNTEQITFCPNIRMTHGQCGKC